MNLKTMAPDRFYRFQSASHWIRLIASNLEEKPSIIDIGSKENKLQDFLPEFNIIHTDLSYADSKQFVQADIKYLPFQDKSFSITVCLDVLEHIPRKYRIHAINEILRITKQGCVFAFPHSGPNNQLHEKILNQIHISLHDQPNEFLLEHQQFGLVDPKTIESISDILKKKFQYFIRHDNLQRNTWVMAGILDYCLSLIPDSSPIQKVVNNWVNSLSMQPATPDQSYRTFLVASEVLLPENNAFRVPDDVSLDLSCLVNDISHSHHILRNLDLYSQKLETSYSSLKTEFEKNQQYSTELEKTLTETRKQVNQLEKYQTELVIEIQTRDSLIKQHKAYQDEMGQSGKAQIEQLESYLHKVEDALTEKEKIIIRLQKKITDQLIRLGVQDHTT
ncbi:methyltransferase domain-containing protein [bacterium]|nr:methyltransferase domain-containing protein [bacterium]